MIGWSRIENFFGTLYLSESHGLQTFGKAAIHRRVWAYRGSVPQNWIIADTTQTTLWDYYFKNWFEEILSALHLENFRKVRNNFKETTRARKNSFTTFSYLMKEIYRRILQPEPEKHYSCKKVHLSYWTMDFCWVQFPVAGPQRSSCLQMSECSNCLSEGQKKLFSI